MPKGKIAHKCEHGLAIKDCPPCKSARQKAWYARYCEKRGGKEVVNAVRAEQWRAQRQDEGFVESEQTRCAEYVRQLRHEVMHAYGGYICACCGETEPLFLELDHVNNDGAEHRRALGYAKKSAGGSLMLNWLKANGYPPGMQVLCANCNKGKARNGGVCPHKTKACIECSE